MLLNCAKLKIVKLSKTDKNKLFSDPFSQHLRITSALMAASELGTLAFVVRCLKSLHKRGTYIDGIFEHGDGDGGTEEPGWGVLSVHHLDQDVHRRGQLYSIVPRSGGIVLHKRDMNVIGLLRMAIREIHNKTRDFKHLLF